MVQVDRPGGSGSYACQVHGGFKLQKGRMLPFPRAQDAPLMVVSLACGSAHPGSMLHHERQCTATICMLGEARMQHDTAELCPP